MKRIFSTIAALYLAFHATQGHAQAAKTRKQPNFIVIFTDDQGYGDLGVYASPNIKTLNIDRMAFEGQKWTG